MPEPATSSGRYEYLLNGVATAIEEAWSCRDIAGGGQQLNSYRRTPGVEINVAAQVHRGLVKDCEFDFKSSSGIYIVTRYAMRGNTLAVSRSENEAPFEDFELDLGEQGALLFPLMRIYTGEVIAALLDSGGRGQVVVPDITRPDDASQLLRPLVSTREAALLADSAGGLPNSRACEYTGDQYGPGSCFWLGEDNTLLAYCWQQSPEQLWEVNLKTD